MKDSDNYHQWKDFIHFKTITPFILEFVCYSINTEINYIISYIARPFVLMFYLINSYVPNLYLYYILFFIIIIIIIDYHHCFQEKQVGI